MPRLSRLDYERRQERVPEKVENNITPDGPELDGRAAKSVKKTGRRSYKGASVTVTTNRSALISAILFALTWTTACQTAPESKSGNANVSTTNNAAQTATNTNQTEAPRTANSTPSGGGSLATPTEAYKTGYAARQNKDIAGLKRVLSKEALQFLTDVGKDEQKTLDDQLMALAERPQAPTAETRNEKINGDRATLEYLNEKGKWVSMDFVKEGGDWKIGLPKAQ